MENESFKDKFEPPKLPFGWIATTFVVPVITFVLPDILKSSDISLPIRAAISLALLSVLLFVTCIIMTLKTYETAYTQQSIKRETDYLKNELQNAIDISKLQEATALELRRKTELLENESRRIVEELRREIELSENESKRLVEELALLKGQLRYQEQEPQS